MTAPSGRPPVPVFRGQGRGRKPRNHTILVLDDHVAFAEALVSVLDDVPGFQAFGATTIGEAQRALAEREVDIVLLEADLNGDDGIRFARQARSEKPDLRVVAVTASEDDNRVVEAVRAGVSGWVPKNEPIRHLVSVVYGVLRGETWIPPRLLTHVLAELFSAQHDASGLDQRLTTLSKREKEVLSCLTQGMKKDEIARHLCVSRNTLRTHVQNILGKLDVHSVLAAVALARRAEMAHVDSSAAAGIRIRPKR
jgi:DNA-binding NarL/FixJ family response regulator